MPQDVNVEQQFVKTVHAILLDEQGPIRVHIDQAGWVDTDEIICGIRSRGGKFNRDVLRQIVNSSRRLEFNADETLVRFRRLSARSKLGG